MDSTIEGQDQVWTLKKLSALLHARLNYWNCVIGAKIGVFSPFKGPRINKNHFILSLFLPFHSLTQACRAVSLVASKVPPKPNLLEKESNCIKQISIVLKTVLKLFLRLLKDPLCLFKLQPLGHWTLYHPPCWSALNFWKMNFDELHFWSTLNLNFAGYTSSKNQVRNRPKMEFVEIHFSKSIFQKSSADQLYETFRIMIKCTGILVTLRKQEIFLLV